ncbi:hypothetical protein H671_4g12427 [Cricetulus griseus]|uniref:Uncharacterized protein n=1 Tax=Cricetulus griseus TaxID=10029 RepID=A0A061I2X0_CRIGR|nr:hypothetical protein H671_4g12427 [Cricetulus griseus]
MFTSMLDLWAIYPLVPVPPDCVRYITFLTCPSGTFYHEWMLDFVQGFSLPSEIMWFCLQTVYVMNYVY